MQRPFPFQLAAAPLGIPACYPAHTNGATIILQQTFAILKTINTFTFEL